MRAIDVASPVMTIPLPVQEALRDSITSGTFIDTKFWVFSKRSSKAGRVGGPKALFVNGHVVRGVSQLGARTSNVFSNRQGFSPDWFSVLDQKAIKGNLRAQPPDDWRSYTGDYDHDADSDLEEDEDWDFSGNGDTKPVPVSGEIDKPDCSTLAGSQDPNVKGDEYPDVISVSDVDSLCSGSIDTRSEAGRAVTSTPAHIGDIVVIEDVAFVT